MLSFYSPANENGDERRYCKVKGDGDKDINSDKVACTKLHIEAEVGLKGLIEAGVKFIFDRVKWSNKESNTGDHSAATNTGDCSAATNTGDHSAATNTGDHSAATNTGDRSAATNTGDRSAATVKGKESVAIVTGKDSKASGVKGSWIVLTERGEWNGETYPIKEVKAFEVDGVTIKENTFYKLVDGKAVEVE